VWDLSLPFELEESKANETGAANGVKLAMRKAGQRNAILATLEDSSTIFQCDIDDGTFQVEGMIPSSIKTLLRSMAEEGIVQAHREKVVGKRGRPPIKFYSLIEKKSEEIA
jgi:hypothetical protein